MAWIILTKGVSFISNAKATHIDEYELAKEIKGLEVFSSIEELDLNLDVSCDDETGILMATL